MSPLTHGLNYTVQPVMSVFFCADATPAISCPSFVGPAVINRTQIEFYCYVITNVTDTQARFNVSFVFNCQPDPDVPVQVLSVDNLRATLHERYLAGRLNRAVRSMDLYQQSTRIKRSQHHKD